MIATRQDQKRFRAQLASIPYESLLDALAEYAVTHESFYRHFELLSAMAQSKPERAALLTQVKQHIDRVFGSDLCPDMFGLNPGFDDVHVVMDWLLAEGLANEVIDAVEYSLRYAENIAEVQEPDDFLGDCYSPLIRLWLLAHKELNSPTSELSKRIEELDKQDEYGVFSCCLRQHSELLPAKK